MENMVLLNPTEFSMINALKSLLVFAMVLCGIASFSGCENNPTGNSSKKEPAAARSPDIPEIARDFRTLKLMTPEPVSVNPEFAMLCIGASKELVDTARIEHGPHANCTVKIYMNESAVAAFQQNTRYPVGSVVIKEKERFGYWTKDRQELQGTGNGVGGMIKRAPGFDSQHGDWEYFYFEDIQHIESGKMESCIRCHSKAANSDFVFGNWHSQNQEIADKLPVYESPANQ